jgi:hypothetical protein
MNRIHGTRRPTSSLTPCEIASAIPPSLAVGALGICGKSESSEIVSASNA